MWNVNTYRVAGLIVSYLAASIPAISTARASPFGNLQLNGDAALNSSGHLVLNRGSGAVASAYTTAPMTFSATTSFISKFTVTMKPHHFHPQADGFAFVIQNDPAGDMALGGNGNCLGVCNIANYAAIAFQSYSNNTAGLWLNGVMTTQFFDTGDQADIVDVTVTYDQATTTLAFTATNISTNTTVSGSYTVDLTTLGSSAYVGFTGASGGSGSIERVTKWEFKVKE